jgi:hypothetical protein
MSIVKFDQFRVNKSSIKWILDDTVSVLFSIYIDTGNIYCICFKQNENKDSTFNVIIGENSLKRFQKLDDLNFIEFDQMNINDTICTASLFKTNNYCLTQFIFGNPYNILILHILPKIETQLDLICYVCEDSCLKRWNETTFFDPKNCIGIQIIVSKTIHQGENESQIIIQPLEWHFKSQNKFKSRIVNKYNIFQNTKSNESDFFENVKQNKYNHYTINVLSREKITHVQIGIINTHRLKYHAIITRGLTNFYHSIFEIKYTSDDYKIYDDGILYFYHSNDSSVKLKVNPIEIYLVVGKPIFGDCFISKQTLSLRNVKSAFIISYYLKSSNYLDFFNNYKRRFPSKMIVASNANFTIVKFNTFLMQVGDDSTHIPANHKLVPTNSSIIMGCTDGEYLEESKNKFSIILNKNFLISNLFELDVLKKITSTTFDNQIGYNSNELMIIIFMLGIIISMIYTFFKI